MIENIRIFDAVSVFFSILSFSVALFFRKKLPPYCRVLFFLMAIACSVDLLCLILARFNIYIPEIVHAYTAIEFLLWSIFFERFFHNRKISVIIYSIVVCFFLVAAVDYWRTGFDNIKSYQSSIESMVMIGLSFSLFLYVMRNSVTEKLTNEVFFWINCAVLIYFAGNSVLFLLMKLLTYDQISFIYPPVHNSLNILYNFLLIIGFLKTKKAVPGVNKF